MSSAPVLKKGWMKKQGRSGVVKNWKKRFFVLNNGKISYYVDELDKPPYGENLKVCGIIFLFISECINFPLM
jgi:hypothetical protein